MDTSLSSAIASQYPSWRSLRTASMVNAIADLLFDTITHNKEVISLFGCQQVLIDADQDTQAIIEYICNESNKVFNCAVYYARQIYFKAHRYVNKAELDEELKANKHFKAMYSQAAGQTCHSVFESFKSFKAGFDLSGLSRVHLTAPQRVFLWSAKKTRSNSVLTRCEVSA